MNSFLSFSKCQYSYNISLIGIWWICFHWCGLSSATTGCWVRMRCAPKSIPPPFTRSPSPSSSSTTYSYACPASLVRTCSLFYILGSFVCDFHNSCGLHSSILYLSSSHPSLRTKNTKYQIYFVTISLFYK